MFFLNGWTDLYQGVGNNYNLVLWSTTAQMYCYLWFPLLVLPLHTVRNTARFIGEVLSFYSLYLFVNLLYISMSTTKCLFFSWVWLPALKL